MKQLLLLTVFLLFIFSCKDRPESGPADIYYGEDICERCKMIISEKDFASQYISSEGKAVKFDDIGCMIHYTHTVGPEQVDSLYVTDYISGDWIKGENAHFVWTDTIKTPMSYGIVSFADIETAQEFISEHKGKYLGAIDAASSSVLGTKPPQK